MLSEEKQETREGDPSTDQLLRIQRHESNPGQRDRPRETDFLPKVSPNLSNARVAHRQVTQLREENKRLLWELNRQKTELQQMVIEYSNAQDHFDEEVLAIKRSYQQEIQQYQAQLKQIMDERNQLHEDYQQVQSQYEDLYQSYQDAIDEEAQKIVSDAAKTLELTPTSMPPLLHDVAQTLELQMKQVEDQHIAEALYLMRESQRKAEMLEKELIQEREKMEQERQNLLILQDSVREQAELRFKTQQLGLRSRWTVAFTMMTTALLILLPLLQLFFFSLKWPLFTALFGPLLVCILLAGSFAYLRSRTSEFTTHLPRKKAVAK